eukprot:1247400-Amphidinium_carterae.1
MQLLHARVSALYWLWLSSESPCELCTPAELTFWGGRRLAEEPITILAKGRSMTPLTAGKITPATMDAHSCDHRHSAGLQDTFVGSFSNEWTLVEFARWVHRRIFQGAGARGLQKSVQI